MAEKVLIEEMTWVEIKEAIDQGKTGVIVVSGAMEQHGPHLPTGTDTILGYELAQRAALKLGNVLVAPVVRPCLSEHHIGFPGSFTLSWETYYDVIEDYCESLARFGFKDIVHRPYCCLNMTSLTIPTAFSSTCHFCSKTC